MMTDSRFILYLYIPAEKDGTGEKSSSGFLHLIDYGLESLGIVHGEIGKHLAVDLNASLMYEAHKLAV